MIRQQQSLAPTAPLSPSNEAPSVPEPRKAPKLPDRHLFSPAACLSSYTTQLSQFLIVFLRPQAPGPWLTVQKTQPVTTQQPQPNTLGHIPCPWLSQSACRAWQGRMGSWPRGLSPERDRECRSQEGGSTDGQRHSPARLPGRRDGTWTQGLSAGRPALAFWLRSFLDM